MSDAKTPPKPAAGDPVAVLVGLVRDRLAKEFALAGMAELVIGLAKAVNALQARSSARGMSKAQHEATAARIFDAVDGHIKRRVLTSQQDTIDLLAALEKRISALERRR